VPVGRTVARVLAGSAGTALGLRLAGRVSRWVGPLRVRAGVEFHRDGGVTVDIPPLGTATVRSHRGPLRVDVLATAVDPARLPDGRPDLDQLRADVRRDAGRLAAALAARAALAGLSGAALTAALGLHRPRDLPAAVASGAALLGTGLAVAAATVDKEAWRDPQLDGLLTKAPLLIGDLRTAPDRLTTYRDQLLELVATGTDVYRKVAALPEPPPADAIRLLHISDIHLSPLAFPLTRALVGAYRVDAVIDTGDLVDWGTPPEQAFATAVADLGVPYFFVKGNHDSDGIAAAVAKQPNATVLTAADEPVEIAGLRLAGMADPRFTPDKTTGDDVAAHRVGEAATAFAQTLTGKKVDIALVHDPAAGRALAGAVPLVLAGHTHKRRVRRYGDTLVLVQGTTGGSGLRGVQQEPTTPIALSVLYIDRVTRRLHTVDEITLGGLGSVELGVVRRPAGELA
jgi:predicted MPP superfamily phosphohydrolase